MPLLKPTIYQKNVFTINYNKLKKQNIKNLLFDIDNTIANPKEKYPPQKIIDLFTNLKEQGFNIFIITNALKNRATRFATSLNIKTYHTSMKPHKFNYHKIIKENNLKYQECAAIGDQLYTDIKGANKLGITSILVDPISNKEFIITKINRLKEKHFINKTKIIKKGEYYE